MREMQANYLWSIPRRKNKMNSLAKIISTGLLSLTSVVLLAPLKYIYLTSEEARDNKKLSCNERRYSETERIQDSYKHRAA